MSDENDDMPPELEDFSEELSKIREKKGNLNENKEIKVNVIDNKIVIIIIIMFQFQ